MASTTSYSRVQIALHWATASLIIANYFISDGMGEALDARLSGKPVIGLTPVWHVWAGSLLLALVIVRLIVRVRAGSAAGFGAGFGRLTLAEKAAEFGHWVLYALMLAVPVLGAITWFGKNDSTGDLHILMMNTLMIVILGHAAMAIFHHYVLKDGTLTKMTALR